MAPISLLEVPVLLETVKKIVTPSPKTLLGRIPTKDWSDGQTVYWTIEQGSSLVGTPNSPDAEAHIVSTFGRRQASASMLYSRDKIYLSPTVTLWIKAADSNNYQRVEDAITDALANLSGRLNNFKEMTLWMALTGQIVLDYDDVNFTVDYQFPASHTPSVGVSWDTATPMDIVDDIDAWKTLIEAHGRVDANEVYTSPSTLRKIVSAFLRDGTGYVAGSLFSDQMRNEFHSSGTVTGFLNLNWHTVKATYQDSNGDLQYFIPDNRLILGNFTEGEPIKMFEGRTADFDAPPGHIGPFSKVWNEKDPSDLQVLLESRFVPVITRPESFIVVSDVTA